MDRTEICRLLEELLETPPPLTVIAETERSALRAEFNPHIHMGWELKQLATGELHLVVPGVPHETTGICPLSLETGVGMFTLRAGGRYLFFNRLTDCKFNPLPELFALLVRIPEEELRLRKLLLRSCIESARSLIEKLGDAPEEPGDLYARSIDYLRRNYYRRELGVAELAAFVGVTPQHLNRLFRRNSGLSIRRQLIAILLEKARELLESGRYLVSDAARLTGWSCPFCFCNSFKRRYGIPPVAVRR